MLRFDEDYRRPKDSIRKTHLYLGGEIREEYGGKINEEWIAGQGYNYSFLQRYSLFADFHSGEKFRLFAQIHSALENGSKYGAAPVDEDKLNIQNFFAEYRIFNEKQHLFAFRVGRQELDYGTGRLISVRDGTNTRQYFTGLKFIYASPAFTADAFLLSADKVSPGVLDNELTGQANLWGVYATLRNVSSGNIDVYYLGSKKDDAEFEEGRRREIRNTLATRLWDSAGAIAYNIEAAWQFGIFGTGSISAWTLAIEMGHAFKHARFKPYLGLRNDYISGDGTAKDGKLQTFNPLYPKGGYFGFNPLIGPANLIDLHPYLSLLISNCLSLQTDIVFNWRYSLNDGIYLPSGNMHFKGTGSDSRYIGTTYLISADYWIDTSLLMSVGAQYFHVGNTIRDIIPQQADSRFFNIQLTYKW